MSNIQTESQKSAGILVQLAAEKQLDQVAWDRVERYNRQIADSLRTRAAHVDEKSLLGQSNLPVTLTTLLQQAHPAKLQVPADPTLAAIYQILRVSANVCADHAANRERLLSVGLVDSVVNLLKAYLVTDTSHAASESSAHLSAAHLRIVKTSIGVLINTSFDFQPVRRRLGDLDATYTVLQLSSLLYTPGSAPESAAIPTDILSEEWALRQGIASWSWKLITELRDSERESQAQMLDDRALPFLISAFQWFPYSQEPATSGSNAQLDSTNLEVLEESANLIESLCLDSEDARVRSAAEDVLRPLVDFIEFGVYPESWLTGAESDQAARRKQFDLCKGALITALTTIAGEDRNAASLWSTTAPLSSDEAQPDTWFFQRMFTWVRDHSRKLDASASRPDIVITGTLCLGNLARRDSRAAQLVQDPHNVIPFLLALLDRKVDIKVKNGAIGLLKNLSQPVPNRDVLGKCGILQQLCSSGIWDTKSDIAETVQGMAIGVTKNLCHSHVINSIAATDSVIGDSCLIQIVALVRRSDTVAIKSEGTRVLANIIKSLCTASEVTKGDCRLSYEKALGIVSQPEYSLLLAQLLVGSQKYPVLLNESIVSMSMVALGSKGASGVLSALVSDWERPNSASLNESNPTSPTSTTSYAGTIRSPLDMLCNILVNKGGKYPAELRTNACSLILAIGRESPHSSSDSAEQKKLISECLRPILEKVTSDADLLTQSEKSLNDAAKKALKVL